MAQVLADSRCGKYTVVAQPPVTFSELAFHQRLVRPGTILDVGANIGEFSRPFSTWEGNRLIAFEPFLPVFAMLKTALMDDHGGKLPATAKLHMVALGEAMGTAKMRVPNYAGRGFMHPLGSLVKSFEGLDDVSTIEFEVPVWTVDGLGLNDVTAIKIDAEGSESEILHGAKYTIERCRPIVSCECEERHREGMTWYIPGFMRALGYDGWIYHQRQFWPVSSFDRKTMQVMSPDGWSWSEPYINTFLFIPRELDDLRQRLLDFGSFYSV